MNHFYRDSEENWWFTTVGKCNKQRQIAVSDSMLEALKRWRKYLGLSALPSPADLPPILPKAKGQGGIGSTTYIRKIVQSCFDRAVNNLNKDGPHRRSRIFNGSYSSLAKAYRHLRRCKT
nr:hypothetical protein [Candidatus Paracaedibacter symbiosus]